MELALSNAIADPKPSHVDGLATLLFDGVVGQANGACIVAENGDGRLWVAQVGQDVAQVEGLLSVDEYASVFGFSSGGDDDGDDSADGQDGAVGASGLVKIAEEMVSTGDASSAAACQVRRVALRVKDNVAGCQDKLVVGVGGEVRQEPIDGGPELLGGCGLFGGEAGEDREDGAVNSAAIVQEHANDLLKACAFGCCEWRGRVGCHERGRLAERGANVDGRAVCFDERDTKALQSLGDVAGERQRDVRACVIERNCPAEELAANQVHLDVVKRAQGLDEVVGTCFVCVLDAEVVDDEGEGDAV